MIGNAGFYSLARAEKTPRADVLLIGHHPRDPVDSAAWILSLIHISAGMEVIKISRQMFHEFQILFQHLGCKTGDAGVCGTGVQLSLIHICNENATETAVMPSMPTSMAGILGQKRRLSRVRITAPAASPSAAQLMVWK